MGSRSSLVRHEQRPVKDVSHSGWRKRGGMKGSTGQNGWIELCTWQQGVAFLLTCAVVLSRRLDAVFHPQFWNEDRHVFFAGACEFGWWSALLRAYEGDSNAFPRLGAALAPPGRFCRARDGNDAHATIRRSGQKGNAAVLFAVRATALGFKLIARVPENRKIDKTNDRGDFPLFGTTV